MDGQTVIALAGIAGTLIAGLGGTYVAAWLARRAEQQREGAAIRRAARLIDADLMMAESAARICVENKRWWVSDTTLPTGGWHQYRDVIAPHVEWDAWIAIAVAFEAVGHLQGSRDRARSLQLAELATQPETRDVLAAAQLLAIDIGDPAPDIPERTVTQLAPMWEDVKAGRRAIASLVR